MSEQPKPTKKAVVNWQAASRIANDLCRGAQNAAREHEEVRGQGEVDFIAGCVIAAKFYGDNLGVPREQIVQLIKAIADMNVAITPKAKGDA